MQIPREGLRIAGDIDNALRLYLAGALQKALGAAAPRRVHNHDIELLSALGDAQQKIARIVREEAYVLNAVPFRVRNRIPHGRLVKLHTDHLSRAAGCRHAYGAHTAVGIEHRIVCSQIRKRERGLVEFLGHLRIHLIEGGRREAEREPQEFIFDVALAVEYLIALAEYHAGLLRVDVLDDGRNLRTLLSEGRDEVLAAREYGRAGHNHHHNLSGRLGSANQNMAERTDSKILVIGLQAEGNRQIADDVNDAIRRSVLNAAVVNRNNPVAVPLVHTDHELLILKAEARRHLVPVVQRLGRRHDGLDLTELAEQFLCLSLLFSKLLLVGQGAVRTAAAALLMGTARRLGDSAKRRSGFRCAAFFQKRLLFGITVPLSAFSRGGFFLSHE